MEVSVTFLTVKVLPDADVNLTELSATSTDTVKVLPSKRGLSENVTVLLSESLVPSTVTVTSS